MPRVTFIVGLCGSGKTTLAKELKQAEGAVVFDDSFADDSSKHAQLCDYLKQGTPCIVADIPYCRADYREFIVSIITAAVKDVEFRWICFEKSLSKASQNVLKRPEKNPEEHLQINCKYFPLYTYHPRAEVREIIT